MDEYQVVAVYPSGRRFDVREPHETLAGAEWHRELCERGADAGDDWTYQVDRFYTGSDGQVHWRGNVSAPKCGICKHESGEHALSCPTRWYR